MERKKCYVAHNIQDDISILADLLLENNFELIDAFNSSQKNEILLDINERIKKCNFTIGILNINQSSNVLFEIGVSYGLGKPTFVILTDNRVDLPFNLLNIRYSRTTLDNKKLLQLAIKEFLDEVSDKNKKKKIVKWKSNLQHHVSQDQILQIENIRKIGSGLEITTFLGDLFKKLNFHFAYMNKANDSRIDFVFWQDDPSGNLSSKVIPVEVKIGNLNNSKIRQAENQLREIMLQENSEFGLLLYLDRDEKRFIDDIPVSPLVIRMDVEDFIKSLKNNDLFSLLWDKRNHIVHKR